jgi:3-deoxy-7-phosphoheptulonate synthase
MIESHLIEGNQSLSADTPLMYGQSITDACVNIDQTEQIIKGLADAIDKRRV